MSDGDRTPEERLVAVETLLLVGAKWQDKADVKLDSLLENGRNAITIESLQGAFAAHVSSCPSRNSPSPSPKNDETNNGKLNLILKGWKGLGVIGSMFVLNGMLTVAILKLTGVF